MKKLLFLMFAAVVSSTASAAIIPSTEDTPVWYQLVSSDNKYLAWQDWGTVYAKIETSNNLSNFSDDMVSWAFIPSGDGYKVYNKEREQYLGITSEAPFYVNLTASGIVWTVDEDANGQVALSCSEGNLYEQYFVYVGNKTAFRFNLVLVDDEATSIASVPTAEKSADAYDLLGRQLSNGKSSNGRIPKGLYIQGGRLMFKK